MVPFARSTAPLLACLALACASTSAGPRATAGIERGPDVQGLAGRCEQFYASDCRTLGRATLNGEGVPRDDRLGAALIMKACELADASACSDLAVLYALGRGLAQNDERAAALSRRACEQGSALGCSNLSTLVAEGAVARSSAEDRDDPLARVARTFRTACDAGVPEACLNLGAALEHARFAPRDVAGAARAYRRGCDAGLGVACHRLAAFLAERPEVVQDLAPAALEARACAAAIPGACVAAGQPVPPESARTPARRLVDDRSSFALGFPGAGGFHPNELSPAPAGEKRPAAEVRRPTASLQAAIPPALREKLAVTGTPGEDRADPPVDLLASLRRGELGRCYEVPRSAAGPVETYAFFLVDGDGHTVDIRTAALPADAELEACAREVLADWEFPVAPGGLSGPYLVTYVYDPAPPGPAPGQPVPGGLRASPRDPGCVERKVEALSGYRGAVVSTTVKVAVDGGGTPGLVHALTPVPEAVLAAIKVAVGQCGWQPGTDQGGRPTRLWATLPVRVGAR